MNLISLFLASISLTVLADPSPAKTIKTENSKCVVKSTAGEYPMYSILIDEKVIFKPMSDGIVNAKISPSGKFVALSGGEISLIDLEKGKFDYGLVIINCKTKNIVGLRKGKPSWIKRWEKDEVIQIGDEKVNLKEKLP